MNLSSGLPGTHNGARQSALRRPSLGLELVPEFLAIRRGRLAKRDATDSRRHDLTLINTDSH